MSLLPTTFRDRIYEKENCWIWVGAITQANAKSSGGYGLYSFKGKLELAHRFAYKLLVGEIPKGLTLDHLCRVRNCVNPEHLEPVTIRENTLRGDTIPARNAKKTHCKYGHPFSLENTLLLSRGERVCKTCDRARQIKYLASKLGS